MKIYYENPEQFKAFAENKNQVKQGIDLSMFINKRKESRLENGIGIVHVFGSLISDSTPIDKELGCTDYDDIVKDCDKLLEQGAKGIVFEFNSGGGEVSGCVETAEYIENLPVPTVAFIKQACSAAYKLATSCNWLVATKSAYVANIGTILVMMDTSKLMESMGVEFICFTNEGATLKSTGHLPSLTEEQTAFLQDEINLMGENFKNHVLKHRPNISEEVWKAGWYWGDKALSMNIVDELGGYDLALTRLNELIELIPLDSSINTIE